MIMKARCDHMTEKSYAEAHQGLCRRCFSNFTFILELEQKFGEDALAEYWYSKILTHKTQTKEEVDCLIDHLIEYYRLKLVEFPSKKNYIKKMLYMLSSIKNPFNLHALR